MTVLILILQCRRSVYVEGGISKTKWHFFDSSLFEFVEVGTDRVQSMNTISRINQNNDCTRTHNKMSIDIKPIDKSIRNMKFNKTNRLKWKLLDELFHSNQEQVI